MSAYNGFKNHVTLSKHPARGKERENICGFYFYLESFGIFLAIWIDMNGFCMMSRSCLFPTLGHQNCWFRQYNIASNIDEVNHRHRCYMSCFRKSVISRLVCPLIGDFEKQSWNLSFNVFAVDIVNLLEDG
ncbi:unnamed protein product [Onchocerca flexuosa]|uniref:Uncharacterized protein n=1 Tax=Onchocerca flexuosa TaxID=387005 RepID=A0A183HBU4_9BILA|nr:unnamed protein product [Onchocerca flexuosa]